MAVRDTLESFHSRLDQHFSKLREVRNRQSPDAPIFALDHGLGKGDLAALQTAVREAVAIGIQPGRMWLPFIVHTAEVGYHYEGAEYWPTLEAQTPGWEAVVGRPLVKRRYRDFADQFGGAIPSGPWATQFSIICWPITHALLPTDLQRQLARLLYDHRGAVSAELLNEPVLLGQRLARRAFGYSKRFQQFAENEQLLGTVAAALLSDAHGGRTILPATLDRIVEDLSQERASRQWLQSARSSAASASRRGMHGTGNRGGGAGPSVRDLLSHPTPPTDLTAHAVEGGWQVKVHVPDFSPLLTRHPDLRDTLANSRCRVAGSSRPRPRGWLLYRGQHVPLERWPGRGAPLFQLERAAVSHSALVEDEAISPPSDPWLFHVRSDGVGHLVRSGVVRASNTYLVVGSELAEPNTSWAKAVPLALEGAKALLLEAPDQFDENLLVELSALGVAAGSLVEVRPVGLCASAWDTSGYAQWLINERPLLQLSATHDIEACTVTLDDETLLLDWKSSPQLFVELPPLDEGWHRVRFAFTTAAGSPQLPDAELDIFVREPEPLRQSGTFRQPIQIRSAPPWASMEELWDGRAAVEVDGPVGLKCTVSVQLLGPDDSVTARQMINTELPLRQLDWETLWNDQVRRSQSLVDCYDEAIALEVEVAANEIGRAKIRAEREVKPVRWGIRRRRDGRVSLRLYESGDKGGELVVRYRSFEQPTVCRQVRWTDSEIEVSTGGLFVAEIGDEHATAVLGRKATGLGDLLPPPPSIDPPSLTLVSIMDMIGVAEEWAQARSSGNLLAEMARKRVLEGILSTTMAAIGGKHWQVIEQRAARGQYPSIRELKDAIDARGRWDTFKAGVAALMEGELVNPPTVKFGGLLGSGNHQPNSSGHRVISSSTSKRKRDPGPGGLFPVGGEQLGEFLLRFVSAPWWISWDSEAKDILSEALQHPVAVRAARAVYLESRKGASWSWN